MANQTQTEVQPGDTGWGGENDKFLRDAIGAVVGRNTFALPTVTLTGGGATYILDRRTNVYVVDTTAGVISAILPTSNNAGVGKSQTMRFMVSGPSTFTLIAATGDTINGASSLVMNPGENWEVWSNGITGWVAGGSESYSIGTWTPIISFTTNGNLATLYSIQYGDYTRVGRICTVNYTVLTSSFTWTTSSGTFFIGPLPFNSVGTTNYASVGSCFYQGITKAGFTQIVPLVVNASGSIQFEACGSGVAVAAVSAADVPSGGTVLIRGSLTYSVA